MTLDGSVDALEETHIAGWAADRADPCRQLFVDILLDGELTATIRCAVFREDLRQAGLGDGHKAFHFDPSPYLKPGLNRVEVRYAGGPLLPHGQGCLTGIHTGTFTALDPATHRRLLALSQQRWKGSEPDAALTWGEILSGDSFLAALQHYYHFRPEHHICEIGPGYGRLLRTILDKQLPFHHYSGVELSEERVRQLAARFPQQAVEFLPGDAATVRLSHPADLLLCSATFEHLFPDFTSVLQNLVRHNLNPPAALAVDFVQADDAMSQRSQGFEPDGHAFVRVYSAEEIRQLWAACGIVDPQIESIVLGQAGFGPVRRIFVFGKVLEN
jgi:SAM-dependent methyltransferase